MKSLQSFSTGAEPVMADFNRSATQLTTATRRLTPFLGNSITALHSLADVSGPVGSNLVSSQPLLNDLNSVAQSGPAPPGQRLGLPQLPPAPTRASRT